MVRHKYSTQFDVNPPAGGLTNARVFSANGLFDPDITGVGHQPNGFDQLAVLFDHYQVLSARVTITAVNGDSSSAQLVGIALLDNATVLNDYRSYMEGRHVVGRVIPHAGTSAIDNVQTKTMSFKYSQRSFFGTKKIDDQFEGSNASNPEEGAFFHIFAGPINSSADAAAVRFQLDISYLALWYEPKTPPLS